MSKLIFHYTWCIILKCVTVLCSFNVALMNNPRNIAAAKIPIGYATAVERCKHSGAQKKYVTETADMNVAGTAVSQ